MIEVIGSVKELLKDKGGIDVKTDVAKIPGFKASGQCKDGVLKDGLHSQTKSFNITDSAKIPDFKADAVETFLPRNDGQWEGESGNSMWRPNSDVTPKSSNSEGKTWGEILEKYKITGIPFKDGYPDFSEVAEETAEIDDFSKNRNDNFNQADKKTADKWNEKAKDGRTDWKGSEVKQYRQDNKLTWHECEDTKTLQLVPSEIHNNVPHTGGISVMKQKAKDN